MVDKRKEYYEKVLVPQLDSEKLLISKAEKAIADNLDDDAILYLNCAFLVNPDNKKAIQLVEEVLELRKKKLLFKFIEIHLPDEIEIFDIAWRVFKNFKPDDFKQQSVAGALGLVGKEGTVINAPKVITIINNIGIELDKITEEQVAGSIIKVGNQIGCSNDVIDKLTIFLIDEWIE